MPGMNGLNDLNSISGFGQLTLSRLTAKESFIESRSHRVCSTHQFSFTQRIQSLRGALWRQQECALILLLGSVSHHGFRATYLPRELARHRDLPGGSAAQALSLRLQWTSKTFHVGRRQRKTRLAHLPRFRAQSNPHRTATLCSFRFGTRTRSHCLRLRRHHHRPLSVALSLGQIQKAQSGHQASHFTGDPQRYPRIYCHHRWRCSRSKPARRTHSRTRLLHRHGPRLRRFPAALSPACGARLFCHTHQRQYGISPSLFSSARARYWSSQRSNYCLDRSLNREALSERPAPRPLLLSRNRPATSAANQQFFNPGVDSRCSLSLSLANRTVLQMDQATSAHQKFLRYLGQQREDPNLDRRYRLRASRNCQKTLGAQARSLHFVTDSESYSFRENPHFKPASAVAIQS